MCSSLCKFVYILEKFKNAFAIMRHMFFYAQQMLLTNVLITIFCSLYDRHSFFKVISIIFQAIQNHHVEQCTSELF